MKYRQLKLSPKQHEMLMTFTANDKLSIDQIAYAKSYSPQQLSRLVNSTKGRFFLQGLGQLPPSILDSYLFAANSNPELIPLVPTLKNKST
jgi:hypothetical protein